MLFHGHWHLPSKNAMDFMALRTHTSVVATWCKNGVKLTHILSPQMCLRHQIFGQEQVLHLHSKLYLFFFFPFI